MAEENTARALDPSDEASDAGATVASGGTAATAAHDVAPNPAEGEAGVPAASLADLALLGDISVNLSMEIGRTNITIAELLSLGKGSVVELQRMADEPLDILVNGTLVAHGEAVVVGERFGIRLTDVVSQRERLARLA